MPGCYWQSYTYSVFAPDHRAAIGSDVAIVRDGTLSTGSRRRNRREYIESMESMLPVSSSDGRVLRNSPAVVRGAPRTVSTRITRHRMEVSTLKSGFLLVHPLLSKLEGEDRWSVEFRRASSYKSRIS